MKINVEVGDIARWEDEVVVVNLFEGVDLTWARIPGGARVGAALAGAARALAPAPPRASWPARGSLPHPRGNEEFHTRPAPP